MAEGLVTGSKYVDQDADRVANAPGAAMAGYSWPSGGTVLGLARNERDATKSCARHYAERKQVCLNMITPENSKDPG
jgi:hypothetical protein